MYKPLVAIVGRPNVGKSTLFNAIVKKRISIVEDIPGVTRDRIYYDAEWLNQEFTMIDTGGIEFVDSENHIFTSMRYQAELAIREADVILYVVDGKAGVQPQDEDIARILRSSGKPVILVVNKIDSVELSMNIYEFYSLGLGDPIGISAVNLMNLGDLLDEVLKHIKNVPYEEDDEETIHIALVGRPNVAKFVLIDTAGMRRKGKIDIPVERYSVVRALRAVDRCDVAVLVLDGVEGVTEQDKKIAGYVHEAGKGCVIVVNKWDLVTKDSKTSQKYEEDIRRELAFLQYAPILFASALTKQRINRLADMVKFVSEQQHMRVSTSVLNELIEDAQLTNPPPAKGGKLLKIYYMTQASVQPPTFILFVNEPQLMHFSYLRFLENRLRETFGFEGTPIRLILRGKKDGDAL